MGLFGKKIKLVTHNGSFHVDDVFACATLSLFLESKKEKFEVIRTRDKELINQGDYVFDVGGVYDETTNRFDHHQVGGAGKRDNGIEYASFGLVWKKFGKEVVGSAEVAKFIDKKLAAPIDAGDNGMDLVESKSETSPYLIQNFFGVMRPTWKESVSDDEMFAKSVEIAKEILLREIIQAKDGIEASGAVVSTYQNSSDKKIIVLEKNYPFEYALRDFPEPLYVIYPRENDGYWGARAIRENINAFKNKKNFPVAWAGLRDEELQKITGVPDAVFCHRGLFLVVAKSKEGAIKLAQIAVES